MTDAEERLDLGPFLERIEQAIQDRPAGELREWIVAFGRRLDPDDRRLFLNHLLAYLDNGDGRELVSDISANESELLESIDEFVRDLENGVYFQGYGWDDQLGRKRSFGDESWTIEMDHLFSLVNEVYLNGDLGRAKQGFEKLLNAFRLEEEPGHFCGPDVATEMIDADVRESACRYLRCVYLTNFEESDGVGQFWNAYRNLYVASYMDIDLASIRDAGRERLPDFESFLEQSIEILQEPIEGDWNWNRNRLRLLHEVTKLASGKDGLKRLARREGADHPEAYRDWVKALEQSGETQRAVQAAREAVEEITSDLARASMADHLAVLCRENGDVSDAVRARVIAWRSGPTLYRLRALVREGWPSSGEWHERMSAELAAANQEEYDLEPPLEARLAMVAGHYDYVEDADSEAIQEILPILLLAGSGTDEVRNDDSAISRLWTDLDKRSFPSSVSDVSFQHEEDPPPPFTELMDILFDVRFPDEHQQKRFRRIAREWVLEYINDIVCNKNRGMYEDAAMRAVGVEEAYRCAGRQEEIEGFLEEIRGQWSRYYAFTRELDEWQTRSPLVPEPVDE